MGNLIPIYSKTRKTEFRKVGYLIKILSYSVLGSNTIKRLKLLKVLRRW